MRVVIMVAMEEEAMYLRPFLDRASTIDMPGVYGNSATRGYIGDVEVRSPLTRWLTMLWSRARCADVRLLACLFSVAG